jgi:hypothetical protein
MTDITARPNETVYQNAVQRLKDSADGTYAQVTAGAVIGVETPLPLPALNTIVVDSAAGATWGGKKSIYLVVSTPLAWATPGQATWRPFVSRNAFPAAGGATTQLTPSQILLGGAAVNLGGAGATSLANGLYRLTSIAVPELANPDALVGIELVFPSILTAGFALAFLESAT